MTASINRLLSFSDRGSAYVTRIDSSSTPIAPGMGSNPARRLTGEVDADASADAGRAALDEAEGPRTREAGRERRGGWG